MASKKVLYLVFVISIICVFTGCTKKQTDNKSPSVTENAATKEKSNDSNKEKPVNLVWMTDSTWTDYLSESRKKAINERIHELGYNYNLSFYGLNAESYESYQNGIDKAKKQGIGDLMWTGYGDGDHPEKDGTYIRQIKQGNLLSLSKWLKSENGKKLKKEYGKNVWKRITYKGKIYGFYNEEEQANSTYLLINAEKIASKPDFMNADKLDIKKLCKWVIENKDISELPLYLLWNDAGEYFSDRFTNLGYIGICDGVYMSDKGIIQNIWENKDVREFWISMAQLKREGLLSCDKNEDYSEALSGNFMAMIATMPKEIMDGNYLYLEDGGKIPVYSRKLSSRYIDKMENDVHGIASWTKHPKESKNLLMLVNTDKELANLICFGEEGKDYSLKNGKVVGEKHVSSYCPAKLANTKFSIYEANGEKDKAKYYYDGNKEYSMSPAAGFVPNKKVVEKNKKILNEVDVFYQKLLESDEEPEKMIDQFVKKLKMEKYPDILNKIQKQYNKWKRGKK